MIDLGGDVLKGNSTTLLYDILSGSRAGKWRHQGTHSGREALDATREALSGRKNARRPLSRSGVSL